MKDVDPNSPTGRRVIADLKSKLDTNDRNEAISFGKKYGIFKNVPIKPAFKKDGGLMEAIEKVKKEDAVKMRRGGMAPARAPRKMGFRDQSVDEFFETIEPFQGVLKKGEQLRNIDGKTMIVKIKPNPMAETGRNISNRDRQMIMQMMGARKMENGGKVPPKFKGFSKLPEDVQEQMNPTLAKKFEKGGVVKMGKGGGVCKGMGIARAGGKFKLR
jgi:hypothetical protein|tara:strand:- start:515 stop:1159 length:645 start_codon:yes stop_codon:yes gene_type:complete